MKSFHEISQFDPVLPITITIIDIVRSDEIFHEISQFDPVLPITITIIDIVRSDEIFFHEISQFDPVLPITITIIDIVFFQIIPRTFTQSLYRLIESSSDTNSFLDVDGELSLKVKQGLIDISGVGKYLVKTVDRQKMVEMMIIVDHEIETLTFPSYTTMRTDWQSKPPSSIGTHYVRSITYGGLLMISFQLTATKTEFYEEIKAAMTGAFGMSGNMGANVTGNLEKLSEQVKDKSTMSISTFATAGAFSPPSNIADCLKLCKEYPGMVKQINNGRVLL
ncbi:uncharacterized protein CEXT_508491 [Caerostris extrusa]|uniref:Uncharacterized protein n=1 Tax=Caerostris extrusa TaxID=172846 RepID=A0AAV4WKD2_CAEEX|nr:uncharacterized protein CEXT_508491 [Caerostris extrusa]